MAVGGCFAEFMLKLRPPWQFLPLHIPDFAPKALLKQLGAKQSDNKIRGRFKGAHLRQWVVCTGGGAARASRDISRGRPRHVENHAAPAVGGFWCLVRPAGWVLTLGRSGYVYYDVFVLLVLGCLFGCLLGVVCLAPFLMLSVRLSKVSVNLLKLSMEQSRQHPKVFPGGPPPQY